MTVPVLAVPQAPAVPIVVTVPHAGRLLPPALVAALRVPAARLRALEDPWVDELMAGVPALGAWLLATPWARAVADVNRAPDEFAGLAGAGAFRATAKARCGLGVVPTAVAGEPLYRRPLEAETVAARLALAHTPYHARLRTLLEEVRARFGMVLLLDCHSMPASATADQAAPLDVALGDCHGAAAAHAIAVTVQQALAAAGFAVARNRPYAGGYVTQHYGRPKQHVHVLQIEFRRGLYMDEARHERGPDFAAVRARIEAALATLPAAPALAPGPYLAAAGI